MALMKMVLRCVLVAILLLTPLTSTNAASAQALQVYDGDTFKILMEGKKVRLRLYGIDAPESGQKGNVSAARFLKRSVFGNLLEIVDMIAYEISQQHSSSCENDEQRRGKNDNHRIS